MTPTATETPSASPPSTPTYSVDISGVWRSDHVRIQSSICPKAITAALQAAIRTGTFNCDYAVEQQGPVAEVVETCGGESFAFSADVASDGTLSYTERESDSADGCPLTITTQVLVDLSHSPTTGRATYDVDFEPRCGLRDCRLVLTARFRRIE